MRFLEAATWGLIVMASLIGWGGRLCHLLNYRRPLQPGLCGALGFCFSVFIAGILGLFHLISLAAIVVFLLPGLPWFWVFFGSSFAAPRLRGRIRNCESKNVPLIGMALILIACRYLASVHQTDFEPQDDFPAYLVFPVKMLETGRFAPDPYSDRRMNGLGGQQWSQALVMAPFDPTVINLFDHGIALLLLLLVCRDWLKSISVSQRFMWFVLLVLTVTYPNYVNTASFVTISALLLALFVILADGIDTSRDVVMLGVLVSGICSLKTTVIPLVGSVLVVYFLLRSLSHCAAISGRFRLLRSTFGISDADDQGAKLVDARSRNRPETETLIPARHPLAAVLDPLWLAAGTASLTFVLLFPWMLAMHRSSNTFLAPFLGHGNSTLPSLAGTMPKLNAVALVSMAAGCILCGLLIIFGIGQRAPHRRWAGTAAIFPLVTAPIILIIAYVTGGLGWMRYSQPFILGWIALPMTAAWVWSRSARDRRIWCRCMMAAIAFVAIGQSFGWSRPHNIHGRTIADLICGPPQVIAQQFELIADGIHWKPAVSASSEPSVKAMQAALPAGAAFLERVDYPHLLDYSRNTIFIADHPGLAYPSPALPAKPQPESLANFLLGQGVRYVAYSYGDQAHYSHANAIPANMRYAWDRVVAERTFGFQDALQILIKSRRILYDDGVTAVIDLAQQTTR